jgi:signal transduction histidine kinase
VRRRIVLSALAVAIVVATVFGIPLAIIGSRYLESVAQERVQSEADRVARAVDRRVGADHPVDAESLASVVSGDRQVTVFMADGTRFSVGPPIGAGESLLGEAFGVKGGTVVSVYESRARVDGEIQRLRLIVLGAGLLAVAIASGVSWIQSKRLSEPLVDLAYTAARLGFGDPTPHVRRYGVAELDRVAETLDASAERVAAMLAAERQFATNASHQLRTPLTALTMRLEEILATDDPAAVREEASVALAQIERLTEVIDRLLAFARRSRAASAITVSVDSVVGQQAEEWRRAYAKSGRRILVEGARGLRATTTPGGLAVVLATLLENALMHGGGTVTVLVRKTAASVVIEVTDEGPGVPATLGQRVFERSVSGRHSTGLGLSVARDLAEADGGRLELVKERPPVFALFLPAAEPRPDQEPMPKGRVKATSATSPSR